MLNRLNWNSGAARRNLWNWLEIRPSNESDTIGATYGNRTRAFCMASRNSTAKLMLHLCVEVAISINQISNGLHALNNGVGPPSVPFLLLTPIVLATLIFVYRRFKNGFYFASFTLRQNLTIFLLVCS